MIPKTGEVSKIHSEEQQRNQAVQHQQTVNSQQKADDNVNTVYSQENSQKSKINEKEKEQHPYPKEKKRKRRSGNYRSSSLKDDGEQTSTIDIRL
jgi:hypothetical protein